MVAASILDIFLTMKQLLTARGRYFESDLFDTVLVPFSELWQVRVCQRRGRRYKMWIYIGTPGDRMHNEFRSTLFAADWCADNTDTIYTHCGSPSYHEAIRRPLRFFWPGVRVGMLTSADLEYVRGRGWVRVDS